VAWGLPLSWATIVGNLIFTPFLFLFLMISALLMITQLLCIPNGLLCHALEQLSRIWLFLLHQGSTAWLLSLPTPPLAILFIFPAGALAILALKKLTFRMHLVALSMFLLVLASSLLLRPTPPFLATLDCGHAQLTIITNKTKTVLIDPGALSHSGSPDHWCEFTLMPYLAQQFGRNYFDAIIILQPSARTFCAITQLARMHAIGTVYLPHLPSYLPAGARYTYRTMQEALEQSNGQLIFLQDEACFFQLSHDRFIVMSPLEQMIKANKIKYRAWRVQSHNLDLYPLKWVHLKKKKLSLCCNVEKPH
jgi:hypothetical protein